MNNEGRPARGMPQPRWQSNGSKSRGAAATAALTAMVALLLTLSAGCVAPAVSVDPRVNYASGSLSQDLFVSNVQADHTDDGRLRARFEIHNVGDSNRYFHLVVFFKDQKGNVLNGDAEKQIHLIAPGGVEAVDDHWYGFDATDFSIVLSPARTR